MQRDTQLLLDMLQSAELVADYMAKSSKVSFVGDARLQVAVVQRLLAIAEAARELPEAIHQTMPRLAWKDLIEMRFRLVDDDDDVDPEAVWDVAQTEIPLLRAELRLKTPPYA
ncbi:MAG: DUF86 domain-containing protein [Nodosilinea sp.]